MIGLFCVVLLLSSCVPFIKPLQFPKIAGPLIKIRHREITVERPSVLANSLNRKWKSSQSILCRKVSDEVGEVPGSAVDIALKKSARIDNPVEKSAIYMLSLLLAAISDKPFTSKWNNVMKKVGPDYTNFVSISKLLLVNSEKPISEISQSIINLLKAILPKFVRDFFKSNYASNAEYICTSSSLWFSFGFIEWLVGPSERFTLDLPIVGSSNSGNASIVSVEAGVKLIECRFLAESKCKSACVNLCKIPCQTLFKEELGVPLYMKPNYTDSSCQFYFGVEPPSLADDPAFNSPCYEDCTLSRALAKKKAKHEVDVCS